MRAWGAFCARVAHVWMPAEEKTLLVVRGCVPVRNEAILYAPGRAASVPGAGDVVRVAPTVEACAADAVPEGAIAALLGGAGAGSTGAAASPAAGQTSSSATGAAVDWTAPRQLLPLVARGSVSEAEVADVCKAVSLVAWNQQNAFSGVDGLPTSPALEGRRRRRQNGGSVYPRVDPVAIVLVESHDGERCLLGRQPRYPAGMYTCISGFVEHGESVENAAMREVLEETAVVCESVALVASQPWPCGRGMACELMLACIGRAVAGDGAVRIAGGAAGGAGGGELEDARWFSREEALAMVEAAEAADASPSGAPSPGGGGGGSAVHAADAAATALRTPPAFAIAHHLIRRWALRKGPWATPVARTLLSSGANDEEGERRISAAAL